MNQQKFPPEGKKLYLDRVNRSDDSNMYIIETDPVKRASLIYGRNTADFPNLTNIQYVPPPVVQIRKKKNSFVHNQVANKAKTNHEHLEKILKPNVLNTRKHKILKELCDFDIDIRQMTLLKNELFESDDLIDNHLVSRQVWDQTKDKLHITNLNHVELLLLLEIQQPDGLINL